MSKILYIFPHPDDESFGPSPVIYRQLQQGHEVFLYTLTKGGATRMRHKYGYSIEEMGEIRYKEMLAVEELLGLTDMRVDDLPDGGMRDMDPRKVEKLISDHIARVEPDIVVTYPVHGVSGFHDHLVTHAVVKRVFLEMKDAGADYLRRLAFLTLPDNGESGFDNGKFRLKQTDPEMIDCIYHLTREEISLLKQSLECYETYQDQVVSSRVIDNVGDKVYFEFFGEDFSPPVEDMTMGIGNGKGFREENLLV